MKTLIAKRDTKISTPWGVIEFKDGETIKANVCKSITGLIEFDAHTKYCDVYMGALRTSDWEVFV